MTFQVGILEALKDWGLVVHETAGWRTRGSSTFAPHGHVCHHDVIGDQAGTHDNVPPIIIDGRADLAGPLANFWLERDGDVHLVAAGRANHAGEGGWRGLSGNSSVWGTEANNLGTAADPWPEVQLETWYLLCAATCEFSGFTPQMVCGHKEWAPTRKIDPHTINMDQFRVAVAAATKGGNMPLNAEDLSKIRAIVQNNADQTEAVVKNQSEETRKAVQNAHEKTRRVLLDYADAVAAVTNVSPTAVRAKLKAETKAILDNVD